MMCAGRGVGGGNLFFDVDCVVDGYHSAQVRMPFVRSVSRLCLGFVGFRGSIHSIVCGCACLLNGALENDTDLPTILLVWATPLCNLVCSLNESIELSVNLLRYVWVSLTWEFFGDASLDGSWISFIYFYIVVDVDWCRNREWGAK